MGLTPWVPPGRADAGAGAPAVAPPNRPDPNAPAWTPGSGTMPTASDLSNYYANVYAKSPGVMAAQPNQPPAGPDLNAPIYWPGPRGPVVVGTVGSEMAAGIKPGDLTIPNNIAVPNDWVNPGGNPNAAPGSVFTPPQSLISQLNTWNQGAFQPGSPGAPPAGLPAPPSQPVTGSNPPMAAGHPYSYTGSTPAALPPPPNGGFHTDPSVVTHVGQLVAPPPGAAPSAPASNPYAQYQPPAAPPNGQTGNPFAQFLQALLSRPGAGTGNPFVTGAPPSGPPITPAVPPPNSPAFSFTGSTPGAAAPGFPSGPDSAMASNAADALGYLRGIAQNGGYPTDAGPAWQAMVDAQQRQLQRNFADLQESFNVSGGRFSSDFGTAATDYWNQANLQQNALLAQMTFQAQEAARQRELSASSTLGSLGSSQLSQLSSQDFQAELARQAQAFQAAQSLFGAGSTAAEQLAAQGSSASDIIAQLGAQGALALQQGGITGAGMLQNAGTTGAGLLYGGGLGAANNLFNAQNAAALLSAQQIPQLLGLGLGGANNLSQLWQSNLGLGGQLGSQQYGIGQSQINNLYQEFLRTQPEYNPLMPYMSQEANAYPPLFYPYFQPSQLGNILAGAGGIAGALPGIIQMLGMMMG